MRYEIDEKNYITAVYFNCNSGTCNEYTGNVPDGYTSLEDWASNANILAYKVVDGNLVYDSVRDSELQEQWKLEEAENTTFPIPKLTKTVIGEDIQISDSTESYAKIKVKGKSIQNGTPTPEAPVEIQSVGDDVNLFNINALNMSNVVINKEQLTMQGSNDYHSTNEGNNLIDIADLQVGETYILSFDTTYTGTNKDNIYIRGSGTQWKRGTTLTITENMLNDRIAFYGTNDSVIFNIKIQKGTVATAYSEYGKGTVEIKQVGKNWFNNTSTPVLKSNITQEPLETGLRLISNDTSTGSYQYALFVLKDLTNYVGKTIRMKSDWTITGENKGLYIIGLSTADGKTRTQKSTVSVSGGIASFVVPELTDEQKYLMVWLYANGGGNTVPGDYVDYNNLIVTIDNEDVSYEPYKGNNYVIPTAPLRSLQNGVKDTIEEDGIHRRVGRYVFTGEEVATYISSNDSSIRFTYSNFLADKKLGEVVCSHFPYNTNVSSDTNTEIGIYCTNDKNILIRTNGITTEEEFKTFLAENNVEVIYELAEEVIEPFDEEQQIAYNDLQRIRMTKGTIYIQSKSGAILEVVYYENNELNNTFAKREELPTEYSYYIVTTKNTSIIPITYRKYSSGDVVDVYINGLKLIKGLHFSISENNIVLTNEVDVVGTEIEIVIKKYN